MTADKEREFWIEILRALNIVVLAIKKRFVDK